MVWSGGRRLEFVADGSGADKDSVRNAVRIARPQDLDGALHTVALSHEPRATFAADDLGAVWDHYCAGFTFVQAAGGAVTDENRRLLVMHRRNMWDLPKGKVDEGEAIPAAAVREVMEECGLKSVCIDPDFQPTSHGLLCSTWHTYDHKGKHFLKRTDWFLMRTTSAEKLIAQEEEDITEVRWMTVADLDAHREGFYPTLHEVIDAWRAAR